MFLIPFFFQKPSNSSSNVIEIPDSPPTLDLSVEQADLGLSNIISAAEAQSRQLQPMEQDFQHTPSHSTGHVLANISRQFSNSDTSTSMTNTPTKEPPAWPVISPSVSAPNFKLSNSSSPAAMSYGSPQQTDRFNVCGTSASDVFFPLSVSHMEEESKTSIQKSVGGVMVNSEIRGVGFTPGLEKSDSNHGQPVPISGPIPSSGMLPGSGMSPGGAMQEGADGKVGISFR
jgi:hypothetical protein